MALCPVVRLALALGLVTLGQQSFAASPRAQLKELVSQLQESPQDRGLRQRIIELASAMKPRPALPGEAEKLEGRAEYAFRNAKFESDFARAAHEYDKALRLAPWHGPYYFNMGLALEKSGNLKQAVEALEFYLLASPRAADAGDVRKRIGALEYELERANSPAGQAERQAEQERAWLRALNGARFVTYYQGRQSVGVRTIDISGETAIVGFKRDGANSEPWREQARTAIIGRDFLFRYGPETTNAWCWPNCPPGCTPDPGIEGGANCPVEGTISSDGSSITTSTPDRRGKTATEVFSRQR